MSFLRINGEKRRCNTAVEKLNISILQIEYRGCERGGKNTIVKP